MIAAQCEYGLPVVDIAKMLEESGTVAVSGLVRSEWLDTARAEVTTRLARNGNASEFVHGPADVAETPAHHFANDPRVADLLKSLADTRRAQLPGSRGTIASALNILTGTPSGRSRTRFHYDASTVTMVVPIFMPGTADDMAGALVIYPNRRPFRDSVLVNVVEKALMQNRVYTAACVRALGRDPQAHRLRMEPGNAYLFWGYRGFHGTLPAADGTLRATLLLHYGNPHDASRLLLAAKWLHRVTRHDRSRPAR